MNRKISVLIMLLIIINILYPALAQSSVSQISIKDISTDQDSFPNIVVKSIILDVDGAPVSNVTKDSLSLTENGEPVNFEISEVPLGVRTVMVLDLGKWISNQAIQSRLLVKDKMQDVVIKYIDAMNEDDLLEIIVIYGYEAVVAQSFTNDKTQLREVVKKLNWNNEEESYGLEAVSRAIPEIADAPNDLFKRMIFISPGIMTRDVFSDGAEEIVQKLNASTIPFYAVHIPWSRGTDFFSQLMFISDETDGKFVNYYVESDLQKFFEAIQDNRNIYEISFRSTNGLSTSRIVTLSYLGANEVSDSKEYVVDPSWIGSGEVQILVNNGEPIMISAENQTFSLPVSVVINGLGNRNVENITFQVNGQQIGIMSQTSEDTFATTWTIPADMLSLGDTELFLEVVAEDELGVVHHGSSALTINRNSVDPLCSSLGKLPGIGSGLSNTCLKNGFTLSGLFNVFLLVAVLALGGVLWFKRNEVVKVSKEVGVRVTNVVERLTNRLRKLEPKARLIAIQGIPEGQRNEFDLFGETPIGRSNGSAELIFENGNVSRLHCVIHEGHTGSWTIEDKESANGTFVNGQKLTPFIEKEIETGDFVELGPVEYGGIKFRFEVVDIYSANDDHYQNIYKENETNSSEKQPSTRITKPVKNQRGNEDTQKINPEGEIDPSDPANQKW